MIAKFLSVFGQQLIDLTEFGTIVTNTTVEGLYKKIVKLIETGKIFTLRFNNAIYDFSNDKIKHALNQVTDKMEIKIYYTSDESYLYYLLIDEDSKVTLGKTAITAGESGDVDLADLTDVDLTSVSNGQVLKYNSETEKWENADESGGALDISDLGDVDIDSPTNGQVLKYNSTTEKWENENESGGSDSFQIIDLESETLADDLDDIDSTKPVYLKTNIGTVPVVTFSKYEPVGGNTVFSFMYLQSSMLRSTAVTLSDPISISTVTTKNLGSVAEMLVFLNYATVSASIATGITIADVSMSLQSLAINNTDDFITNFVNIEIGTEALLPVNVAVTDVDANINDIVPFLLTIKRTSQTAYKISAAESYYNSEQYGGQEYKLVPLNSALVTGEVPAQNFGFKLIKILQTVNNVSYHQYGQAIGVGKWDVVIAAGSTSSIENIQNYTAVFPIAKMMQMGMQNDNEGGLVLGIDLSLTDVDKNIADRATYFAFTVGFSIETDTYGQKYIQTRQGQQLITLGNGIYRILVQPFNSRSSTEVQFVISREGSL